jgi:hypothetical protein
MKKLEAGKLYVFPKDTPNPVGDKRKKYGTWTELATFRAGLTLKAISRRQVMEEFYRGEPELPERLALFSDTVLDEVTRLEAVSRGRGIFSWSHNGDERDDRLRMAIFDSVIEKARGPEDRFREAGYPFDDKHDRGFERVCEFAAREGLLSFDLFETWVNLARQAGELE